MGGAGGKVLELLRNGVLRVGSVVRDLLATITKLKGNSKKYTHYQFFVISLEKKFQIHIFVFVF